ncbi:type II toxin-antitoxin system RatA family toxin [Asticcacaulis sp. EMRT-3]|uniref:type II toxin-antitoxin system RatA family toxin n=1 Tax=Asticcacaulis sp. EMRT-3 TaxID=3040349 RepID=UPI0024AFB564|nr:type II toxin-antitoxin system RatA family toxin [Asticcacaulis sp. EMRT-3]MDI7774519.1 type II toxin-antitoxin system RatA family toxin [Asticcacaulis sp. EMRT-3]
MATFRLERHLPYDADALWALVGDVEHYPDFIPWIKRLRAYNREAPQPGHSRFDADVSVGFKMLTETFSTRIVRNPDARSVDIGLIKGPFRTLKGHWTFTPDETGTQIGFDMELDIRNPLLNALFKANFNLAVSRLMKCFEDRAAATLTPV